MSPPWMKFYPADWRSDPKVRMCSLAARGLWIEMLCLMHEADPRGHLVVNGQPVTDAQLALLTGTPTDRLPELLGELESAGVFSRTRNGVIYSRRITRDEKKAKTARNNGKMGGNPSIRNKRDISASDNLRVKGRVKGGVNTQKPEARNQKSISSNHRVPLPRDGDPPQTPDPALAVADRLFEITGIDPAKVVSPRWHVEQTALCRQWLDQGRSVDAIVDTVRAVVQRRKAAEPNWAPSSLKYFDAAVREDRAGSAVSPRSEQDSDREKMLRRAVERGLKLLSDTEERVFVRLELLEQTGRWLPEWGEPWSPSSGITKAMFDVFREPIERLRRELEGETA